ncbi:hypothetical protein KHQ81_12720 [Mycoplasmatota bacterium]|nr:hypothetical protein KHQ81_12720 [Mycoplasmatota bacterium]
MNYLLKKSLLITLSFLFIILTGCKKEVSQEVTFEDIYKNMKTQNNFYYKLKIEKVCYGKEKDITYIVFLDMTSEDGGIIEYQENLGYKTITGYYQYHGESATHFVRNYGSWEKQTLSISDIDDVILDYSFFYEVINDYDSSKKIGSETLSSGEKVTEYLLTKDLVELIKIILGPDFKKLSLTEQEVSEFTKDVSYHVYLDLEEKLIRKIDLDLTDTVSAIIKKAKEQDPMINIRIDKIEANIVFNYFGEFNLTIDDEIKNEAVDIS